MLNQENIDKVIFEVRAIPVMLDLQAAYIYKISIQDLRDIVKSQINRFPDDFLMELTSEEIDSLVEQQIVTKDAFKDGGYVFSEQGIAMLSVVLPTSKALAVSLDIMRTYARHTDWLKEEEKAAEIKNHIKELDLKYNQAFQFLLNKIESGGEAPTSRNPIGFKINREEQNNENNNIS